MAASVAYFVWAVKNKQGTYRTKLHGIWRRFLAPRFARPALRQRRGAAARLLLGFRGSRRNSLHASTIGAIVRGRFGEPCQPSASAICPAKPAYVLSTPVTK